MPGRSWPSGSQVERAAAVSGDGGADPVITPVPHARVERGDAVTPIVDVPAHADDLALDGHRVVGVHACIPGMAVTVAGWDGVLRVQGRGDIQPDWRGRGQRCRLVSDVQSDRDIARIDAAVVNVEVQDPAAARCFKITVPGRVLEDSALVAGRDDPFAYIAGIDQDEVVQPDAVRSVVIVVVRHCSVRVARVLLVD